MQTLTRGRIHLRTTVRTLHFSEFADLVVLRTMIGASLFSDRDIAIEGVALTTPVNGENNEANDTTDDKQQNRPTGIDVHAAAKQDEDQADGEESQQAPTATFDEGGAFIIAHESPMKGHHPCGGGLMIRLFAARTRSVMTLFFTRDRTRSSKFACLRRQADLTGHLTRGLIQIAGSLGLTAMEPKVIFNMNRSVQ